MAKGPMYVKDFNFSSAGKTVGRCDDGMTKMASGGYYSKGGSAKAGQSVQMAKSNAVAKSLVGQKATPYAKGGMKEAATGEKYPSRRAMMKHESMETPRMQREEVMQSRTVKAPMRRQMPVAPTAPMIQPGGMKKGGFVKGGTGMVKTEGTLGIKGNKNPGERNGKPTTATKAGNVPFKKGGEVNKYAVGGKAAPTQTGALNQMAAQQSSAAIRRSADGSRLMPQRAKPPVPQPTQTMLAGSQPMPPGMQQGQQPSQQQFQQMMAQMAAARAGQGMPGQQGPQGQLFGQMPPQGQQQAMSQMPPEMAAMARMYAGQPSASPMGQPVPQQAMGGQPLGPAPAGATPPPGYGFGNPQNAPPQASPQLQQAMAAYQQQRMGQPLGGPQPMPTQQGMQQQAPMGMGLGKFS